ncbi:hypothetical protein HPP92_018280 [Vanilla planifolia]|uniref:CP12 domain-containing protein n=1 Tax=Vanilla planifolia TaxID=51239 RepID=A0A835UP86_VANPL|nr:hypothetical protein HPP92_018899 [Vanilla planifolia]KAG0468952.1 hypothetical protein HPP92_018280 [Vanilla planifolia]
MASLSFSSYPTSCSSSTSFHLHYPTSMLSAKPIPNRVSWILKSRRGPAPAVVAAGKRYWGTAMREKKLADLVEKKLMEAKEVCSGEGEGSIGCRVVWDEVEELSMAKADFRRRLAESESDPLEPFCQQNPDSDECRIFEC